MNRPKPPALRLEALEDRTTPAIFGEPWLDGRHLTLSFAGDGTPISGAGSNLTGTLGSLGLDAAKLELLRAFQTWAANANLNIGLVSDNGAAFGSAGAIQNDPRFGDIRVGTRVLAGDVVAVTAPFSLLTANSGDFILNAAKEFAFGNATGKYDLFTVALQESGHAFGVGNSGSSASAMYEVYGSARIGLSDEDVAAIRGLYGARDSHEGTDGNDTLSTATSFAAGLEADLTTTQDVDMYRYTADSAAGRWFRIRAAGLSLLSAQLDVLDANGQVVGSAQAASSLQNDVTVYIPQLVPGATYYLRVSAARSDVFGIGSYRLVADVTASGYAAADPTALVDTETSANNTASTAATAAHSTGPYDYSFRSSLASWLDEDYFRIHSPATGGSRLTVTVAGVGKSGFLPDVDVYSAAGVKLATKTVAQTDSTVVLSLDEVAANTDYLIRVGSSLGKTGNYDVVADFRASLPKMMGATGNLDNAHRSTAATLNIWQSQTVQVNLLANLVNGTDFVGLARIYDSQNRIVFDLFSLTGLLSTGQVFLPRGQYRIQTQSLTGATINFSLTLFGVTDPIGTSPTDPTGDPAGGGGTPLPPPPDPTTTVGITPTTTTTVPNSATATSVTTTVTTNSATGTITTTTSTTDSTGATTTATATEATTIVWF
jgi:Matrixin